MWSTPWIIRGKTQWFLVSGNYTLITTQLWILYSISALLNPSHWTFKKTTFRSSLKWPSHLWRCCLHHQKVSLSSPKHCWNTMSQVLLILYRVGPVEVLTLAKDKGEGRESSTPVVNQRTKSRTLVLLYLDIKGRENTWSLSRSKRSWRGNTGTESLGGKGRRRRRKRDERIKYRLVWQLCSSTFEVSDSNWPTLKARFVRK